MAKEMLKSSKKTYVELDREKLDRFKSLIINGTWKVNRNIFVLVRKGKVMNGRHRLTAIAETGIPTLIGMQYDK
jgi:hypothetical protein